MGDLTMLSMLLDLCLSDKEQYGSKASVLGELIKSGEEVPSGFALSSEFFTQFLEYNNFHYSTQDYLAYNEEIYNFILDGQFSSEMEINLLGFFNNMKNKEIQGNEKLLGTLNEVIETVVTLNYEIKVQETVDNLKLMLSLHPDFAKAIELESGILQTLPKTLETIKTALINNIRLTWLKDINKAIEAHRLGKFIQTDLASNPDNIDEVAMRISKISEEKRNLVIKAIKLRRKISLKYASIDMSTRQQVTKLNKLLSKKRKTVSLVQLKGQVSYTKLLTVFPCWIMSIDDVARVFPLQAGLFDYLIVDEASQCNQATALHLAFRAKRMIVVGDEKQMKNPNVRFLSDNLVQVLLSRHGLGTHHKAEFLHGRESLLSLSNFSANSNEFLNEHFRCEPPIIAGAIKNFMITSYEY